MAGTDPGRGRLDKDQTGFKVSAQESRENSGDHGRAAKDDSLPHRGSDCDRDAPADQRRGQGRPHLRQPWQIADYAPTHLLWRHKNFIIDAAGIVVAVIEDDKIAQYVVELINHQKL